MKYPLHTHYSQKDKRPKWGGHGKGGFYSEGADTFVISSNRQTLLFSWAWILKIVKLYHIRTWSGSKGSNKAPFCYLSIESYFTFLFYMIRAL